MIFARQRQDYFDALAWVGELMRSVRPVATGQPSDAPAGIADRCLTYAASVSPDRLRGVMYDAPVAGAGDHSATERLAHLLGHDRPGRVRGRVC